MKHDEKLRILGEKVVLIPYREEHVPKYHNWMEDLDILRLTGSERLSLEQEFDMQKTWENDADKCTFIILSQEMYEKSGNDDIQSMVGDTNLFLNVDENDPTAAEIEIMVAEKDARKKGLATEALKLMMNFGRDKLGKKKFIAKIKQDNNTSIKLFERLGYSFVSKSDVFQEVTLVHES